MNAHKRAIGVYQVNATPANGQNLTFTNNKIHSVGLGFWLAMPYNVDIGYNEMYDLWTT